MKKILFVCTGNTCRSPIAEALLKHKMKNVDVQSAGLFASIGGPTSEHTVKVLQDIGVPCEHTSQQVNQNLIEWADIVLTMTEQHRQHLHLDFPKDAHKIHTLKQFVDEAGTGADVIDPFGGTVETYRVTLRELERLVDKLVTKLHNE